MSSICTSSCILLIIQTCIFQYMLCILTVPFVSQTQKVREGIYLESTFSRGDYCACSALSYLEVIPGNSIGLFDFSLITLYIQSFAMACQFFISSSPQLVYALFSYGLSPLPWLFYLSLGVALSIFYILFTATIIFQKHNSNHSTPLRTLGWCLITSRIKPRLLIAHCDLTLLLQLDVLPFSTHPSECSNSELLLVPWKYRGVSHILTCDCASLSLLTFLPLVILLLLRLCSVCSRMPSLISLAHSPSTISDCLLIFLYGLHGVLYAYFYGRILSTLLNSFLSSLSGGSLFCFSLYSSCLIRLLKSL